MGRELGNNIVNVIITAHCKAHCSTMIIFFKGGTDVLIFLAFCFARNTTELCVCCGLLKKHVIDVQDGPQNGNRSAATVCVEVDVLSRLRY